MVVDRLRCGAVTATTAMQAPEEFLLFGINTEHGRALHPRQAAQGGDVAELCIALHWIDDAGDQFLAQRARPKPPVLEPGGRRIATDSDPVLEQCLRETHRIEIRPPHPGIGRTAGGLRVEHVRERGVHLGLTLDQGWASTAGSAHSVSLAAWALRILRIAFTHRLQFLDTGVERAPTHAQNPRHIGDAAVANLQRLQRCVAATVVFWQRACVQTHRLLMRVIIAGKIVHGWSMISVLRAGVYLHLRGGFSSSWRRLIRSFNHKDAPLVIESFPGSKMLSTPLQTPRTQTSAHCSSP